MINFEIRAMRIADWPGVEEIYRQGIETGSATFETDVPSYSTWDREHLKACRLVATVDGRAVGWAALSPVSSRCVYGGVAEVSIYIAPDYRNQGIGRSLLARLEEESEAAGFWTLQSGIMEDNESSVILHEKCGFRMVGIREKIGRDTNGKWRSTVLMERRSKTAGID